MSIVAAIDVGSNAMRMAIARISGSGRFDIMATSREAVRLGEDVFSSGVIADETIRRAAEGFVRFRDLMDQNKACHVRAVATSASREAKNRDILVEAIRGSSGIELSVISAEEEARLIHDVVASRIELGPGPALLVELGGGSVEATISVGGSLIETACFMLGAVRLKRNMKTESDESIRKLIAPHIDEMRRWMGRVLGDRPVGICVGTGGNVECLDDLRKSWFDLSGSGITLEQMRDMSRRLQAMGSDERIRNLGLRPDRADVIVPAVLVFAEIMAIAGVPNIKVPCVGLKEGLLHDFSRGTAFGARTT
ncbi:MAG: hypothetical protein AAB229_01175 [Candidatus Hydrogenedentota bacterium]